MRDVEQHNMIKLILRGQTNSFGNIIYDYANKLIIAGLGSQSNFFMSMYQISETMVGILFNLFGGIIADRKNRKQILIITDVLAAILTFLVYSQYRDTSINVWLLIIINALLAVLYSFNSPAYKAVVKDLLNRSNIYVYNSYSKGISEVINVCTPFLGMIIISTFGFKYGMLINSFSFLISAVIESKFVVINISERYSAQKESKVQSLKYGVKYITTNQTLLIVLVASSLMNFFLAGYNFYLPFTNEMSHYSYMYAFILISESIGNICGAVFNNIWKKNLTVQQYSMFLLGVAIPCLIIPVFTEWTFIILLLFALSSAALTIFNIQMMSGIQANVSEKYIGRVFGVVFTIAVLFMPLGTIVFSLINIKSWAVFLIIGIGEIAIFTFMQFSLRLNNRRKP